MVLAHGSHAAVASVADAAALAGPRQDVSIHGMIYKSVHINLGADAIASSHNRYDAGIRAQRASARDPAGPVQPQPSGYGTRYAKYTQCVNN